MPVPASVSRVDATAVARATVEYMDDSGLPVVAPLATSSQTRFESSPPVRIPRRFKGQGSFDGLWWMATTRSHVAFESWRRRDHLIALDFDPGVIAVAFRPFTLHWHGVDAAGSYVPDYFARRVDGTAVVIDVQSGKRNRFDDASTVASALCAQLGWSYERLELRGTVEMANLRWLAGYRHPRCHDGARAAALCDAFVAPRPLTDGIADVGDPLAFLPTLVTPDDFPFRHPHLLDHLAPGGDEFGVELVVAADVRGGLVRVERALVARHDEAAARERVLAMTFG